MKKYFTGILFCLFFISACIRPPIDTQTMQESDPSFVKMYSFQEFLDQQTTNPKSYKKELSKQLTYPPIYRENKVEGAIQYLLNHSEDGQVEVRVRSVVLNDERATISNLPYVEKLVLPKIQKSVQELNATYLETSTKKYQTTFSVLYDLAPYETDRSIYDKYDFVVKREKVKMRTETMHQSVTGS